MIAIDLGSNSFRVLIYDCEKNKSIAEYEQVVATADGLAQTGLISDEAVQRIVTAIEKSSKEMNYNPKEAVCVTTAAMRKANNSEEVINIIKEKTGAEFKIIDGNEEARLTFLAVEYALKRENINSDKFVLVDIGGGSTEIIVKDGDTIHDKSFHLGIVTLSQDENKEETLKIKREKITNYIKDTGINPEEFVFVATAGTPTTIAALKHGMTYYNYDKHIINGKTVSLEDLHTQDEYLKSLTEKEAYDIVGARRKYLIEVGIIIFKTIYEILDKQDCIVLDDGLREGIAIDYCVRLKY